MINIKETERIITKGSKATVRLGENSLNTRILGFVNEYHVIQTTQILEAHVIGSIMPITHDENEVMCKIFGTGFIPHKDLSLDYRNTSLVEAFHKSIELGFIGISKGTSVYLDFFNNEENKIFASFFNVGIYLDGGCLIGHLTNK